MASPQTTGAQATSHLTTSPPSPSPQTASLQITTSQATSSQIAGPQTNSPSSTSHTSISQDLWTRAVNSLSPEVLDRLKPARLQSQKDVLTKLLKFAEEERQKTFSRRWRIKKPSGEEVIVRDVMEKVIYWVHCFKEVGDNAVQHDPAHAALPWAAVRLVLQATVNHAEFEGQVMEDIELIAQQLARYHKLEDVYMSSNAPADLQDAMISAYVLILTRLAKAIKFYSESTPKSIFKAAFRKSSSETRAKLFAKEAEVLKFAGVIDSGRLLEVAARVADLSQYKEKVLEEQKYVTLLNWLSETNHIAHHEDIESKRISGTGDWLLRHSEYDSWMQSSTCVTMLIHGIQGCGKTFLCSAVIEDALINKVPLAYFYCSRTASEPDRRNAADVIRSLLRQLTAARSRHPKVHDQVLAKYDEELDRAKQEGFEPRALQIGKCETLILDVLKDNPAMLVIDALDELDGPEEVERLLACLENIRANSTNVVKMMITSRDGNHVLEKMSFAHNIRVTPEMNKADVTTFIKQEATNVARWSDLSIEARNAAVDDLVSGAGEMFQWAKLQLSRLQTSVVINSDVSKELARLAAATLDELYRAVFDSLFQSDGSAQAIILHSFSWILYARELFSVDAFLRVLRVTCEWEAASRDTLIRICGGLVYIDSHSNVVRFVHESVRAFLHAQPFFVLQEGQYRMSLDCLHFLRDPPLDELTKLEPTQAHYDYAVLYFGHHMSTLDPDLIPNSFKSTIEKFLFDEDDGATTAWLQNVKATFDSVPQSHPHKVDLEVIMSEQCTPLFPICAFSMTYTLQGHSWPQDFDWNLRNTRGHTALYVATYFGHDAIATFLLNQSAKPDIECGRLGSALQCAAYRGHANLVKLLVGKGSDPKQTGKYRSAIHAACMGDRENIARILLRGDAYKNITQHEYETLYSQFINAGFVEAMLLLQQKSSSPVAPVTKIQQDATNMFHAGAIKRSVVMELRNQGMTLTDLHRVVLPGSLATSAMRGHKDMAQLLLDQGVDVDEPGDAGTPLRCASAYGHGEVCRLLLDRGADVNANGKFGGALHAAAMRGHLNIVKILLDFGADPNTQGGLYGTPLQAAAFHGSTKVVRILLDAKADIAYPGISYDAMHAAAEGGHLRIIQMFIDTGFQSKTTVTSRRGGIVWSKGAYAVMDIPPPNILRDSSPDNARRQNLNVDDPLDSVSELRPYHRDLPRPCLLEIASALGHFGLLNMLLENPDSFAKPDCVLDDMLGTACRHDQPGVVRWILKFDRELTLNIGYALYLAATLNNDSIVQVLLDSVKDSEDAWVYFQIALHSSLPRSPSIFLQTMRRIRVDIGDSHYQPMILECLPYVSIANRAEIVELILMELSSVEDDDLLAAFKAACDAGSADAAQALSSAMKADTLPVNELVTCVRLAVQEGQVELLRLLLSKIDTAVLDECLDCLIVFAAGDGLSEVLNMLLILSCGVKTGRSALLTEALHIAAENGHHNVCRILLREGAKPYQSCRKPRIQGLLIARDASRKLDRFSRDRSCRNDQVLTESAWTISESLGRVRALLPISCRYDMVRGSVKMSEHEFKRSMREMMGEMGVEMSSVKVPPPVPVKKSTAVEACLSGCKRFTHVSRFPQNEWDEWRAQGEAAHAKTLNLLLVHAHTFEGKTWTSTICKAAAFGPPDALELMLRRGADPKARIGPGSAMEQAVKRTRRAFPVVQSLVNAGAIENLEESALQRLLSTAVALFEQRGEFFATSSTISEIFESGSGAVVHFLLQRLPKELASGDKKEQYELAFQMAAAAGRCDFVQTLVTRGVNVNAICSYYGTALQAACRFGQTDVVSILLKAGADPTITTGRYSSIGAAAVASGNLEVVRLLLHHKAATASALELAIFERDVGMATILIEGGVNTESSLVKAWEWGNIAVIKSLLASGVDMHAVKFCWLGLVSSGSAMHAAIYNNHLHVVRLLLDLDFDVASDFGKAGSPLTMAAGKGSSRILDVLLLAHKYDAADILLEAAQYAVEKKHHEAAMQIFSHGRTHIPPEKMFRLCVCACHNSSCELVKALLEDLQNFYGSDLCAKFADLDVRNFEPEVFSTLLCYIPCHTTCALHSGERRNG